MQEDAARSAGNHALDEVAQLVQSGQWAQARTRCEELVAAAPQDADALAMLGRIAMGQYRWEDAIAAYDRVLRMRVDPWTLGNIGVCHWKLGNLGEAEYCLRGAIEIKPDFTRAHVSLANVLHGLRRFDDALAQLAAAETIDAEDHQVAMRRGCALAALGRYDEAQQVFAHSVHLAGRFSYPRLVAFDRAMFDAVTTADEAVPPPRIVLQAGAQDGGFRYVVLISCNPPYVRKYGFPFIRSFAQHGGGASLPHRGPGASLLHRGPGASLTHRGPGASLLHLHIYDPDESVVDEVASLVSGVGLTRYAVTTEDNPFPAHETKQRKAYYACGRLVHLPYWLDLYRRPLLSLDVDFVAPDGDFTGYRLVVAPSLPILEPQTLQRLENSGAKVLFGPRTGSRTVDGHLPDTLPPGPLADRLPIKVTRVESLRPGSGPQVTVGDRAMSGQLWREILETGLKPLAQFADGGAAWVAKDGWHYLATWPEPELMDHVVGAMADEAGLALLRLEEGVRLRTRDGVRFAFNFAPEVRTTPAPVGTTFLLGSHELPPAGVAAWRVGAP